MAVSVTAAALGIVGIIVLPALWRYAALVVAILGAVTAMMQTIVRNYAGDEIDESEL